MNSTPLAGGIITATSFTSSSTIGSGMFSTTSATAVFRIEFTYSGGTGQAKEANVDDVFVQVVSLP